MVCGQISIRKLSSFILTILDCCLSLKLNLEIQGTVNQMKCSKSLVSVKQSHYRLIYHLKATIAWFQPTFCKSQSADVTYKWLLWSTFYHKILTMRICQFFRLSQKICHECCQHSKNQWMKTCSKYLLGPEWSQAKAETTFVCSTQSQIFKLSNKNQQAAT